MKQITDVSYIFSSIREHDAVYVDKTAYLYQLVKDPLRNLFFIARPRRFGKSLMLSTLHDIFEGKKELFEGLAIARTDYDWQTYPVIHLSFANRNVSTAEMGKKSLTDYLESTLCAAGYAYNRNIAPEQNFANAIQFFHRETGKQVVLLIDEYDAPVGEAFDDLKKAEEMRSFLADIYGQIKDNLGVIRFAMLTGVTRFTNLSVFSKLNNMVDLTLDPDFATMLGYTEEELIANFSEHMHAHAQKMGLSDEVYLQRLRAWYDGYRFSHKSEARVYNPLAIAKTLVTMDTEFTATWTTTGHPSIIARFARRNQLSVTQFLQNEYPLIPIKQLEIAALSSVGEIDLLYQTGYLTLDERLPGDFIRLKVPNEEVRQDYKGFLLDIAVGEHQRDTFVNSIGNILYSRNFSALFDLLTAFFAKVSYSPTETGYGKVEESNYLRLLQTMLEWSGLKVSVEVNVAGKRADLVLEAMNAVFIFELKRSDNCASAKEAIAQIRANHYAEPYLASGQPIYLIGLVFDKDSHLLADAAVEPYTQA